MLNNSKLNGKVIDNFINLKLSILIPPFLLLFLITLYFVFYNDGSSFINFYSTIQKDLFLYLNSKLSILPNLQYNLTQLGDALIFFPLVTVFIIYAPKLWEGLLSSAILSLIVSAVLKKIFAVPRPAAMFDNDSFTIIGKTLTGKTSLPSGHSICTFIVISILLFAFMPKKNTSKILWSSFILSLGLVITFSRVGVGAHYPLDVIIGSTIGYILGIIGIKISTKVDYFSWFKNEKLYPVFIIIFTIWSGVIVKKIVDINLPIFYISLFSLLITIYLMTISYVQKNK